MLHARPKDSSTWEIVKLAAAIAAAVVLSGCAVTMPLRPLTIASQASSDRAVSCLAGAKCASAVAVHRPHSHPSQPVVAARRSQPVVTSRPSRPVSAKNIAGDPPDFIVSLHASLGLQPD
jgi:hypothetical protein